MITDVAKGIQIQYISHKHKFQIIFNDLTILGDEARDVFCFLNGWKEMDGEESHLNTNGLELLSKKIQKTNVVLTFLAAVYEQSGRCFVHWFSMQSTSLLRINQDSNQFSIFYHVHILKEMFQKIYKFPYLGY